MPRPSARNLRQKPFYYILFFGIIASIFISGFKLFVPFMVLYMIIGLIQHIYNWFKLENTIEMDFDEFIIEQIEQNE
jgi:hypothetical protein